ncbi:DUF6049 family protein [Herbiconiux sp. L3-i23]|uniref:DUF6049 family protein n=1 Tax=Herbiconiux sp. L3-i23 TaxID=2905871 RepID=UPI00206DECC2|nr:DUF6049 family protein [Herbiconiux sp. L3-i23]BDI24195.1 glycoprotein [Herbiconiux sp. L3-i23]
MLAAAVVATITMLSGFVAAPAATAADGSLGLVFAPENSGLSRPGEPLVVSGTVTNQSDRPLAPSVIEVGVVADTVGRDGLDEAYAEPAGARTEMIATIETPPLPVAGSAQLSVTVPPETLDAVLAGTGWGAHPVVTSVQGDSENASVSALVRLDGEGPRAEISIVLPITAPPGVDGIIAAETLEEYTGPSGVLTRKLDAAADPRVALALDPRILASIRVLGTRAPASAVEWLQRLESLSNEVFPLQYGDADVSLERAAGSPSVLQPTSFASVLDPADFPAGPATPTPTQTGTPTPTPSVSPTEGAPQPTLPTVDELFAFDYTATDIAWPAAGIVGADDLSFAGQAGYDRSIVSAEQLDDPAAGPVVAVDGSTVLVADTASTDLSDAVFALGSADGRFTASRAAASLAVSAQDSGSGALLLPLSRSASTTTDIEGALRAMLALPWLASVNFESLVASPGPDTALAPLEDPRVETARTLLAEEAAVSSFSSVLAQPDLLTGAARLDLMTALGAGWADDPDGWRTAVGTLRSRTSEILGAISIDPSSQINVAGFTADTPIYISNALPYPVTVQVQPRSSNGRLVISGATATIDAGSTQRVPLQARAIGNGRVTVEVRMTSPTGVEIGTTRFIQLDVQPYWETAGIAVMGVLVAGLLGFGTYRSIRRRRSATAAAPAGDDGAGDPADRT